MMISFFFHSCLKIVTSALLRKGATALSSVLADNPAVTGLGESENIRIAQHVKD